MTSPAGHRAISHARCRSLLRFTPRWLRASLPVPGFSSSTNFLSGGSAIAKLAYPGLRLAGSALNSSGVERDCGLQVVDVEG